MVYDSTVRCTFISHRLMLIYRHCIHFMLHVLILYHASLFRAFFGYSAIKNKKQTKTKQQNKTNKKSQR